MILDLFITHYNEPWEVCRPGFEMLKNQRCVNWDDIRVTVVHDGTPVFPEEYFADYPFTVNQYSIEHKGIAGARNWCIDHSEAEWIKWNDIDDMFSNVYSLKNIMEPLKDSENFDLLWFDVYAEYKGKVFLKNERDPVVLHGKVFRREFLKQKKLRFNESLTWCEDSAFLAVMEMEIDCKRIGKITCECPIYAWVYREGSLCNRPEIRFDNLKSFFRRHVYVYNEFKRRGHIPEANTMIARVMCDSCYTLTQAGLKEDTSDHEKVVWSFFQAHRQEFLNVTKKNLQLVIDATNKENENCHITRDSFVKWLRELRIKYEKGCDDGV